MVTTAELNAALARLGYESFRPGQQEAVETILTRGRLLLVAPTGGGKSLTYQLPATLLGGTTLVISPLISLMQDQVAALSARGVAATFFAATLDATESRRRMSGLGRGDYTIAYVAPERLAYPGFRALVRGLNCPLLTIDEAHCIAEWGHDFRPEYLQLGELIADLPQSRVLACTATATPIVRDEILARLGLPDDTPQLLRGFARPNLALRVRRTRSPAGASQVVDETLGEALGAPGRGAGTAIIYAPTRRQTEAEHARLRAAGWRSAPYHAGFDGALRDRVQRAFRAGRLDVVVATNAFGMGIDRPDVRAVIHLAAPGSIEAYYQEVGRAGRDGQPAIGVLCTSPADLPLRRRLLEQPVDGVAPDPARVQHRWSLFLELIRWAESGTCRHDAILRYFGDEAETLAGCGHCDNCLALDQSGTDDPTETAIVVRKALAAVARTHKRFGLQAASKLLAGVPDPRLQRAGLDSTKTFGALRGRTEEWLVGLLRRCVTAGWVDFTTGDRPLVVLTPAGKSVLFGQGPVRLLLPPDSQAPRRSRRPVAARRITEAVLDPAGGALFESLRRRRLELARAGQVPPYVVASDRTLREMAELRPRTMAGLQAIYGIGPAKAERYGDAWLAVLNESAR